MGTFTPAGYDAPGPSPTARGVFARRFPTRARRGDGGQRTGGDRRGAAAIDRSRAPSRVASQAVTGGLTAVLGGVSVRTATLRAGSGGDGAGGFEMGWLAVPAGYLAASVPFSYLAARLVGGVDLRRHGSGTVSGTGLYEVAGFGPLAVAGILEVAKGAVGPLLARGADPAVSAAAAAAAVAGHNWSPWLRGAGGRGLSPAIGALLVGAPVGAGVLLGGMAAGRLAGETAIGTVAADAALVPVVHRVHGADAGRFAAAVLVPMLVKRLTGNAPPAPRRPSTYLWRFLFDRDTRRPSRPSRPRRLARVGG